MKKLAVIVSGLVIVLTCVVPVSSARSHRTASGQCYMSVSAPRGASVYTSSCTMPAAASAGANNAMQIGSAIPASCWADTQTQFECGRIGVVVVVQLPASGTGHITMQVASSRWVTTSVQLMVTWG
jgi:hypothetical protein